MGNRETQGHNDSNEQNLVKKGISFKEDLTIARANKNISQEEIQILAQYEQELRNPKSQARKEWRELALDIRKDFQKTIGVNQDGAIGKETIEKLIKKAGIIDSHAAENPIDNNLSSQKGEKEESIQQKIVDMKREFHILEEDISKQLNFTPEQQTLAYEAFKKADDRLSMEITRDDISPSDREQFIMLRKQLCAIADIYDSKVQKPIQSGTIVIDKNTEREMEGKIRKEKHEKVSEYMKKSFFEQLFTSLSDEERVELKKEQYRDSLPDSLNDIMKEQVIDYLNIWMHNSLAIEKEGTQEIDISDEKKRGDFFKKYPNLLAINEISKNTQSIIIVPFREPSIDPRSVTGYQFGQLIFQVGGTNNPAYKGTKGYDKNSELHSIEVQYNKV